jgi:hypothetical protein
MDENTAIGGSTGIDEIKDIVQNRSDIFTRSICKKYRRVQGEILGKCD